MATAQTKEKISEIDFTSPATEALPAVVENAQSLAPASEPVTMLNIIERAARDPNVDVDKLDRLLQMQDRVRSQQAQVAFDTAMQAAQSEMGPVRANAENPQTRSKYATYAALDHAIRPIYSKHGFALSFNTGDAKADEIRVLCIVSHREGHRQEYKIDMPADGKGAKGGDVMTRTHATGAGASYGQRYLLKLIFNMAVGEIDDDGNGADGDIESLATGPRDADGKLLSTYNVNKAQRAKTFADDLIQTLNHADREAARQVWTDNWKAPKGSRVSPLAWLELHAPEQFERVKQAHENAVS